MKILRVIGLGLAIIMLRFLVPEIYHALENTLLSFFDILQTALHFGKDSLSAGVFLPQLPQMIPQF
ncbi:MAG: hypothetical protein WC631_02065 [Candidatus Paceibacterota bacterium]|jgi:hypothetical protein